MVHRLLFHFIDVVIVQSWLLYRRDCDSFGKSKKEQLNLLQFKAEIAEVLCVCGKSNTAKRGRPSVSVNQSFEDKKRKYHATLPIPCSDIRQDQTGHWSVYANKKGRCKFPGCKGIPKVMCQKCNNYVPMLYSIQQLLL